MLYGLTGNVLSFVSRSGNRSATIETMDKSREHGSDGEHAEEDPVEKKLAATRLRLREAHQRLTTSEHAIISATRSLSDEDDRPTDPKIIVPEKS
jgi:hypothetical protein